MVLVSYKLNNDIGIFQTQRSHREGHEARRIGREARPLDQPIPSSHGEREAGVNVLPPAGHAWLQVAAPGQPRAHRCHQQAGLSRAAWAHWEMGGIARGGMEAGLPPDHHASVDLPHPPRKGLICDLGGGTRPPHNPPHWCSTRPRVPPTLPR